jgi:hypothetical protein
VNVTEAEAAVYADVVGAHSRTAAVLKAFRTKSHRLLLPSILETELKWSINDGRPFDYCYCRKTSIDTTPDPFGTGIREEMKYV